MDGVWGTHKGVMPKEERGHPIPHPSAAHPASQPQNHGHREKPMAAPINPKLSSSSTIIPMGKGVLRPTEPHLLTSSYQQLGAGFQR